MRGWSLAGELLSAPRNLYTSISEYYTRTYNGQWEMSGVGGVTAAELGIDGLWKKLDKAIKRQTAREIVANP